MADGRSKTSAKNGRLGGRPKLYATKLHEALIAEAEAHAKPLAKVLAEKALSGDLPAIKEIIDRGIGKALQNVDHTTNGQDIPTPIINIER